MYGKTIIRPVETDTIVKDNKDDFGKYISYNYIYIDSEKEVNGKSYIKERLNQICHIIIMFIAVLRFYQCLNEL